MGCKWAHLSDGTAAIVCTRGRRSQHRERLTPEPRMPLADQIACVKREIALRERIYPRRIAEGRMREPQANTELARMRAVLATLEGLHPQQKLDL